MGFSFLYFRSVSATTFSPHFLMCRPQRFPLVSSSPFIFCVVLRVVPFVSSFAFQSCAVSALSFVQFIEQGKWRSRGLWGRYACSMPPFRPHRAGEMPFYATVRPISLLDDFHEMSPAADVSFLNRFWWWEQRVSLGFA